MRNAFSAIVLASLSIGSVTMALAGSQLWQIGGYPLPVMQTMHGTDGPLLAVNPARQSMGGWDVGLEWQLQSGDPRRTTVQAVPRHDPLLPRAAGVRGTWHELRWRAGFQQLYNSHEESLDSLGAWQDFDARLEGLGFQLALPVRLQAYGLPEFMAGLGWQRYRLVVDQLQSWTTGAGANLTQYQLDVQRKLLADGLEAGIDMMYEEARVGLSWRQETTWNHFAEEPLNPDSSRYEQVWGVLPEQWTLRIDLPARPGWRVSSHLQWTEWSASQLYLKDQLDLGAVVHGDLPRWHSRFHLGFSTSRTASSLVESWGDKRSTWFLLAGGETELPRGVTVSLKLADSHLGSGEYRKQTIVQAGVKVGMGARRP
jgi:hypothetical protein